MPGASLRNAVKRITHKERGQPAARKRFGLLEKKTDHRLRAGNYKLKRKRVQALERKAEFRNPEEFYHRMVRARTKRGVHQDEVKNLTGDEIRAMNASDAAYLTTKRQEERNQIERLKSRLHFIGETSGPKSHVIFVDDEESAAAFDPAEHFDTAPELVGRAYNRPRKADLATREFDGPTRQDKDSRKRFKKAMKARAAAYEELHSRMKRADKIEDAVLHVEHKKNMMSKGRRYKVKDAEKGKPAVFRWKQKRKR